jgi:hypothetical protein
LIPSQNANSNPVLSYKVQNNALPENNILYLKFSFKSSKQKAKSFYANIEEISEKQYLGYKSLRDDSEANQDKNMKTKKKRGRKKKKIVIEKDWKVVI